MIKKKLISSVLAFSLIFSMSTPAFADSGKSALPNNNHYLYKTFAPRTQTSFKVFSQHQKSVGDIRKEGDQLVMIGTELMTGGGIASGVSGLANKITLGKISNVTIVSGGVLYYVGKGMKISVKNLAAGAVSKQKVYFRWTNPDAFEYQVKIESWVEYKGTKLTNVKTTYRSGDLL